MCGISGFFDKTFRLEQSQLEKYNKALAHRGPDGNDIYFDKTSNGNLGFAHTRLAILDLSDLGKQPMYFENLTIILNGEIYNFRSIQKELEILSYTFTTSSDTEVILKIFHAWGNGLCKEIYRYVRLCNLRLYHRKNIFV
jgi:asparagine synthase (glutamine-hydrolysing)